MKKIALGLLVCGVIALLTVAAATSLGNSPSPIDVLSEHTSNGSINSDLSTDNESSDINSIEESQESQISTPPEKEVISFVAVGDNIMHTSILFDAEEKAENSESYSFDYIYEDVYDYIKSKDLAYVNVETLIGGPSAPVAGYPMFNSPEEIGNYLVDMGFDVMNLAHNHMLDSGNTTFLKYCDNFFNELGVTTLGYYENQEALQDIPIVEKSGVKIAFLAYTYGTNGIAKSSSDPTYIPYIDEELIKMQVKLAKEKADLVFVSMHWGLEDSWGGTNNVYPPNDEQREVAQLLVDKGVDVIIGMHPHVVQECKWVERPDGGRTFLVYSLGNFISGMYWGRNMVGAMLEFDIVVDDGNITIENPTIVPIVNQYTRRYGEVFRDFKIYFLNDYTEELAAAHGCHAKDDLLISTSLGRKGFTLDSIYERIYGTFDKEFLPEYMQ